MLHYTAFGDVKKINKKNISRKNITNSKKRIIEGMADTSFDTTTLVAPTFDSSNNRCKINDTQLDNFWNQGSNCYQSCPSNAQQRENGFCKCGLGGDNDTCNPSSECINNLCVPVELLQNVTATKEATATATAADGSTTAAADGSTATAADGSTAATAATEAAATEVQPYSTDLKTLQIDGNLTMAGQINATSYGNVLIGADGKICIGDACLNKDNIQKLMQLLNQ